MKKTAVFVILPMSLSLAGCEPLRGITAERDYQTAIDLACVDETLRDTFPEVKRWDYISDGDTFVEGAEVAQFAYYQDKLSEAWATIEIGPVASHARISHSFTGIGAELPQDSFPLALLQIKQASEALSVSCNVDMSDMKFREIGQEVDALN